jgi:hypothetical protein
MYIIFTINTHNFDYEVNKNFENEIFLFLKTMKKKTLVLFFKQKE